jgi:quercetin dioxygenase-like cupin family protein
VKTARILFLCAAGAAVAFAQQPAAAPPAHVMTAGADLVWGDPPPALGPGAKLAVLAGNPGAPGPFVVRFQAPAGYRIAPHWHPTEENVTVLSGTFAMGMGETFDEKALKDLPAGGYAKMPAEMRHYALAKTAVTLQVHGTGPFTLTYVNPADDPRNKK